MIRSSYQSLSKNWAISIGGARKVGASPIKEAKISVEEINAELAELFESDVKEFSENGAKAFGHILKRRGIKDPQKWFEEKMRENKDPTKPPYSYNPNGGNIFRIAHYILTTGAIEFFSPSAIHNKFRRAHEMAHKIMLGFWDYDTDIGRAIDEGITNLIAEKLCGISYLRGGSSYKLSTFSAWKLSKRVGRDTVFEAAFCGSHILKEKWENLANGKYSYTDMLRKHDERLRLTRKMIFPFYRVLRSLIGKPLSMSDEMDAFGINYVRSNLMESLKSYVKEVECVPTRKIFKDMDRDSTIEAKESYKKGHLDFDI
ncbi:MAG: hypothetical protein FWE27_07735 [Defluviitaleaceae bacterium]|nr:hypothetical protein [Defluviitaleaceae bacterium]